ncbi:MAG TPA: hypothetical protein VEA69_11270 [Tepidisphaeraceae bacterium]|nr:hypothetical protein [Tepidisphaeraceae bacterium]
MPRPPFHPPSSLLHHRSPRQAKAPWPVVVFLAGFGLAVVGLAYYYLLPAAEAVVSAKQAGDHKGQRAISATAALLLAVLLIVLICGIFMTFRIGRYFFPRNTGPRVKTQYVDAWAESAKRMPTPPPDSDE